MEHTVLCLDNLYNGTLNNVRSLIDKRNFKLILGDIRDKKTLGELIKEVDFVIHLAAQIHVDRSIIEPDLTFDVNVLGTLKVLELCRRYDAKIIYASSSEVYGSAIYTPMDENHPLESPHPYGASKIAADRLCYSYIKTYGLDVTILRAFNTFGPRQKDIGYGGAISIFIKRVLNNHPPLIYGDGNQTRDYCYIDDLVRAYELLIEYDKPLRDVLNVGTGKEIRIVDLANLIIKLAGKKDDIKPVHISKRPGEVQRLCANYNKIKSLLDWEPKVTLEEGLIRLIEWYRSYKMEEWEKP